MTSKEIWQMDAVETAAAIRAGKLTSRAATEAALARLNAVNPKINAVVNLLEQAALEAADRADRALADSAVPGPLHGVPITTKINMDLAGQPTTNGIVALKDNIAATDSAPVANLKAAGAVIIGQTNVPDFCHRWFTANDLHGRTLNPWGPEISVGGSSGGAAAAAATGIGTLAHGNDVAGSLRLPASLCGVYGMKATMGRLASFTSGPGEKPLSFKMGASEGVIARSVRDIRLGIEVLSRPDPRDPDHVVAAPAAFELRRPCRVALYAGDADMPVDPGVAEVLRQAGRWLEDAGYIVEEAAPPRLSEMSRLWMSMLYAENTGAGREAMLAMASESFRISFHNTADNLPALDKDGYIAAWAARSAIQREWLAFFQRFPVILTPTACAPAFPVDHGLESPATMAKIMAAYSPLPVVAGLGLPAISVPAGRAGSYPAGVQLIARWHEDERVLSAAEALEARIGTFTPIDPVEK